LSFKTGKAAGEIFGVRGGGGTRQKAVCPNDWITIAATVAEGNRRGWAACCFDEDGNRQKQEFTTEETEFTK
jgi:hypothetical protein